MITGRKNCSQWCINYKKSLVSSANFFIFYAPLRIIFFFEMQTNFFSQFAFASNLFCLFRPANIFSIFFIPPLALACTRVKHDISRLRDMGRNLTARSVEAHVLWDTNKEYGVVWCVVFVILRQSVFLFAPRQTTSNTHRLRSTKM